MKSRDQSGASLPDDLGSSVSGWPTFAAIVCSAGYLAIVAFVAMSISAEGAPWLYLMAVPWTLLLVLDVGEHIADFLLVAGVAANSAITFVLVRKVSRRMSAWLDKSELS